MEQGELINAFSLPLLLSPRRVCGALFYKVGVFAHLSPYCDQPVCGSRGNQGAIARGPRGIVPFIAAYLFCLVLLILFPQISLFLPGTMK